MFTYSVELHTQSYFCSYWGQGYALIVSTNFPSTYRNYSDYPSILPVLWHLFLRMSWCSRDIIYFHRVPISLLGYHVFLSYTSYLSHQGCRVEPKSLALVLIGTSRSSWKGTDNWLRISDFYCGTECPSSNVNWVVSLILLGYILPTTNYWMFPCRCCKLSTLTSHQSDFSLRVYCCKRLLAFLYLLKLDFAPVALLLYVIH